MKIQKPIKKLLHNKINLFLTKLYSMINRVIFVRKYYLFIIKKEYGNTYKNKSYVLYKILENLSHLKTCDFSYGIQIFEELCLPFSVKLLSNYIDNRISYRRINSKIIQLDDYIERTYLQLGYPCTIIKSNINNPKILKVFHIYSKEIFVCDFENKDYFWLSEQIKSGNFTYSKHIIV